MSFESVRINNDKQVGMNINDISALYLPPFDSSKGEYLYGVYIDENDNNPATKVHYIPGTLNYGFRPISTFPMSNPDYDLTDYSDWEDCALMPKPCILNMDGTVYCYLNPRNYYRDIDGVDVTDLVQNVIDNGQNVMMEFPCIYIKTFTQGSYHVILASNKKLDPQFECYSCLKADGTYNEHFYLAAYEGCLINNVVRSVSVEALPSGNNTTATDVTRARENGVGWDIWYYSDWLLIQYLYLIMFKNTYCQSIFGKGTVRNSQRLNCNCRGLEDKGLFAGDITSYTPLGIKCFGIHNIWGHRRNKILGLLGYGGYYYVKYTKHTRDGSTGTDFLYSDYNDEPTTYIKLGATPTTTSASTGLEIKCMYPLNGNRALLPLTLTNNNNFDTSYTNAAWYDPSKNCIGVVGGSNFNSAEVGIFCLDLSGIPSLKKWSAGPSLSYRAQ